MAKRFFRQLSVPFIVSLFLIAGFSSAQFLQAQESNTTEEEQIEALLEQIEELLAIVASLQAQLAALTSGEISEDFSFNRNLKQGDRGQDVLILQRILNQSSDTQVAISGAGSPGSETTFFGTKTKTAVIKYQEKASQ